MMKNKIYFKTRQTRCLEKVWTRAVQESQSVLLSSAVVMRTLFCSCGNLTLISPFTVCF